MPFGNEMSLSHKAIMNDLLNMYKSMRYLWDKSHPSYQIRSLRVKGYKKLLAKYQEIDEEATLPILKGKLDNMRTSYIRELKKVRASQESNSNNVYSPSLWYFDQFSFLENHVKTQTQHKCKSESIDRTDTDSLEYTFMDYDIDNMSRFNHDYDDQLTAEYLEEEGADNSDSCSEIPPKRLKVESPDPLQGSYLQDNDWEIIGKAIGVQLRELERNQAAIAQKVIAETLFYAKFGRLSEESTVSINNN